MKDQEGPKNKQKQSIPDIVWNRILGFFYTIYINSKQQIFTEQLLPLNYDYHSFILSHFFLTVLKTGLSRASVKTAMPSIIDGKYLSNNSTIHCFQTCAQPRARVSIQGDVFNLTNVLCIQFLKFYPLFLRNLSKIYLRLSHLLKQIIVYETIIYPTPTLAPFISS